MLLAPLPYTNVYKNINVVKIIERERKKTTITSIK